MLWPDEKWFYLCTLSVAQVVRNPLQRFTFPVDIESSAQFKSPTKPSVADFSKRAVCFLFPVVEAWILSWLVICLPGRTNAAQVEVLSMSAVRLNYTEIRVGHWEICLKTSG